MIDNGKFESYKLQVWCDGKPQVSDIELKIFVKPFRREEEFNMGMPLLSILLEALEGVLVQVLPLLELGVIQTTISFVLKSRFGISARLKSGDLGQFNKLFWNRSVSLCYSAFPNVKNLLLRRVKSRFMNLESTICAFELNLVFISYVLPFVVVLDYVCSISQSTLKAYKER